MAKLSQRFLSIGFLVCLVGAFLGGVFFSRIFFTFPSPTPVSSHVEDLQDGSLLEVNNGAANLQLRVSTKAPVPIVERIVEIKKEIEVVDINEPENEDVVKFLKLDKDVEETVRNCLGKQCFDEKPLVPGTKTPIDRVGLLAPRNSGGEVILKIVEDVAKSQLGEAVSLVFVLDTHVPTYGYGKNHGWARIVRLYRSIVPHSLSLLHNESNFDLVDLQIKQLMRWHCRLNHVAAHTKMLSINTDDMVEKPLIEVEKILTFIGIKTNRAEIIPVVERYRSELNSVLGIPPRGPRGMKLLTPGSLLPSINKAISDEWQQTDGLTKWPCPSFKDIDQLVASRVSSSVGVPRQLAMNSLVLAANCSDPFVKCTVGFDRKGG